MSKKYKCIAIHPHTGGCDLDCSFCYKDKKSTGKEKSYEFWYGLVPEMAKYTEQIAVGACIEENEPILVKKGGFVYLDKMKNIDEGDLVLSSGGIFRKVIKKTVSKRKEVYTLSCTGGKNITLTHDHLVPTINGLKKVNDINIGDVLIKEGDFKSDLKTIDLYDPDFRTKGGSKLLKNKDYIWVERSQHKIKRHHKIDAEFCRLCGYYISEGSSRAFSFSKLEHKRIQDCMRCFKHVFGLNLKYRPSKNSGGADVECDSNWIISVLSNKLKMGKGSHNKSIGILMSLSKENSIELLKGVFGGDGWFNTSRDCRFKLKEIYSCSYNLTSSSKMLRDDIFYLLENKLKINCTIRKSKGRPRKFGERKVVDWNRTHYTVSIYSMNQLMDLKELFVYNENYESKFKIINDIYNKCRYKDSPKKSTIRLVKNKIKKKGDFNVVDLTIEGEPYFVCGHNILVHNCGEPFMDVGFMIKLASLCKKNGLIANVTTNGRKLMEMNDSDLKNTLKDFTMVSISFDKEKVKTKEDYLDYWRLVNRIKSLTKCEVGCNLLIDKMMFEKEGIMYLGLVKQLFDQIKVDRIFSLYPKNSYFVDIVKHKKIFEYLTIKYDKFYIDDLSKMVLEQGYKNWKTSCHYGKDLVSINEEGIITGCSFDCEKDSLLKLEKAIDLNKLDDIKIVERFKCPYLKLK